MDDLQLLAARFLRGELPKASEYLQHYFTDDNQIAFAVWHLLFRELHEGGEFKRLHRCFVDHTGLPMSERWLYKMIDRIRSVEHALLDAERANDPKAVALVRSGKWKPTP